MFRLKKKKYINKFKRVHLMTFVFMIALYHQIKTLINFWRKRGLNSRCFIQPLMTLDISNVILVSKGS